MADLPPLSVEALPPLNALRAFESAARRLSFTKAAEELGVTPGAVSQQIKLLEDYAGAPLFRRTGRQVFLTELGQAVLPELSLAFDQLNETARTLRAPKRRNRLMVSCAPSFAAKWLAPRLDSFQHEFEGAEIWISADIAIADFSGPDIDLAIRYGPGDYEGLRFEKLMSESVLPVCSPALLTGSRAIHAPEDLKHHALLHDESPENDPLCPDWSSWLAARGVKGVNIARGPRFNQSSLVVEAAAAGRGVALAKRAIAAADMEVGRLVAPFADGTSDTAFSYWVVWPRGRTQSEIARAFINWLKAEARDEEIVGV